MSLPKLADYQPPTAAELPAGRANWTLSPERCALLVHDMQGYFTRIYPEGSRAFGAVVRSVTTLLEVADRAGVPVVYTAAPGGQDPAWRGLQTDLWGPGPQAVPEHTDIIAAVAPPAGATTLTKHRYSAFVRTPLADWLRERGRDQLVVTGVYAHIGVVATATDAFCRDIAPFVVADGVAAFDRDSHLRALTHAAQSCAVVIDTATVRAALDPAVTAAARWEQILAELLDPLLEEPAAVRQALADPQQDLFELGLDSVRAMYLLTALGDCGIDVDFGEFTATGTVGFLRDRISESPPVTSLPPPGVTGSPSGVSGVAGS
ncbi:isochorismatase family protein [Solwaraspora sp. WMMB335]|uniref:isochorismatase family protein n=1 Tax=Solwaraspora sp. WMMB335 TaxID=3404118 RepID=UPI003B936CCC